jgi:uncharacterized membrane protein YkvA (DUF1232 family)
VRILIRVRKELAYYRALLTHPRTPWISRMLLGAAIAYFVSPIDLIPDFIPVLGQLDDLVVVTGLIRAALAFIPADIKAECREKTTGSAAGEVPVGG